MLFTDSNSGEIKIDLAFKNSIEFSQAHVISCIYIIAHCWIFQLSSHNIGPIVFLHTNWNKFTTYTSACKSLFYLLWSEIKEVHKLKKCSLYKMQVMQYTRHHAHMQHMLHRSHDALQPLSPGLADHANGVISCKLLKMPHWTFINGSDWHFAPIK